MSEETLRLTPIDEIKAVVDTFADLGIDPLHLHVDGKRPLDQRPDIRVWVRYRMEFERVIDAFGAKPKERDYRMPGQREWFAEKDTDGRRLLLQCVSFEHHDDWQPRPKPGATS
jgi:hypothetical protein